MDERTWVILLRLAHVVAGVFWVGTAVVLAWFLLPAQAAAGPAGGAFIRRVMQDHRLAAWMAVAMGLTLLSGFGLYGRMAGLAGGAWTGSRPGMAFGIGGLAAVVAALLGFVVGGRTRARMAAIGQEIQSGGGAPDPALAGQMQALRRRAGTISRTASVLGLFATACMAVARYL